VILDLLHITLFSRVVEDKISRRGVICSIEWENSCLSKESKGKDLEQIISNNPFGKAS
jgi:hypothetical protein